MKRRSFIRRIFFISLFIALCVFSVSAVSSDRVVLGIVSKIDQANNTISINTTTGDITGYVPDRDAFTFFDVDSPVIGVISGGSGGRWISLAQYDSFTGNQPVIPFLIGDPARITTPFEGNYSVRITITPDCSRCNGSICQAAYANVSLERNGKLVSGGVLFPDINRSIRSNNRFYYSDQNDRSHFFISFISGETDAGKCTGIIPRNDPGTVQVFEMGYSPDYPVMPYHPDDSLWIVIFIPVIILVMGALMFYFGKKRE